MDQHDGDLLIQLLDPEDERAWRVAVGHTLRGLLYQTTATNGRVSRLEKFMFMVLGGLAVVTAIVVPLFIDLVQSR